jgi:hypothetical protein
LVLLGGYRLKTLVDLHEGLFEETFAEDTVEFVEIHGFKAGAGV